MADSPAYCIDAIVSEHNVPAIDTVVPKDDVTTIDSIISEDNITAGRLRSSSVQEEVLK